MIRQLLRRLLRRSAPPPAPAWLEGLAHLDEAAREEDREAGRALARALHGHAKPAAGLGRREAAVIHAARRRRPAELLEALEGLPYPAALRLGERLAARPDLDRGGLAQTARRALESAARREEALAALALLALAPSPADLPRLLEAARSAAGAPAALRVAAAAALPRAELHSLLAAASGIGRALALEAYLHDRSLEAGEAPRLLELMAGIEDPLERAWASAPLLEAVDAAALLAEAPALGGPLVLGLEANARGGWRGGPGPGLGRLPGSIRAAEALLTGELAPELMDRAARAVVEAHPAPHGEVLRRAEARLRG